MVVTVRAEIDLEIRKMRCFEDQHLSTYSWLDRILSERARNHVKHRKVPSIPEQIRRFSHRFLSVELSPPSLRNGALGIVFVDVGSNVRA